MPAQRGYKLDLAFLTTSPVHVNGPDNGGTGFFFTVGPTSYLVTAGHVLADGSLGLFTEEEKSDIRNDPPEITYFLRAPEDVKSLTRFAIDLSDEHRTWGFDPEGGDIAIIELDQSLSTLAEFVDDDSDPSEHPFGSLAFREVDFLGSKELRTDRAYNLSYPGEIYDRDTKFPVRRNTLISSPINFDYSGKPRFLTDARMDPGTSGAPVLVKPSQVEHPWGEPLKQSRGNPVLIGIHAGNVPHESDSETTEDSMRDYSYSDLNETWRPEGIKRAIVDAN